MHHSSSQIRLGKSVLLLSSRHFGVGVTCFRLVFLIMSLVGACIEDVNNSMTNGILIAPIPLSNRLLAQRARPERQQQNGDVAKNVPFHIGDERAVSVRSTGNR